MNKLLPYLVSFTIFISALFLFARSVYADGHIDEQKQCKPTVVYRYVYRDVIKTETVTRDVTRKNRLYLIGGDGPSDTLRVNGNTVSSGNEAYLGLGYMRDFGKLNLGVKAQTNEDVGVTLGLSW